MGHSREGEEDVRCGGLGRGVSSGVFGWSGESGVLVWLESWVVLVSMFLIRRFSRLDKPGCSRDLENLLVPAPLNWFTFATFSGTTLITPLPLRQRRVWVSRAKYEGLTKS